MDENAPIPHISTRQAQVAAAVGGQQFMQTVLSGFLGSTLTGVFQKFTGLHPGAGASGDGNNVNSGSKDGSDVNQTSHSSSGQKDNDNNDIIQPSIPFVCGTNNQVSPGPKVQGNNNNIVVNGGAQPPMTPSKTSKERNAATVTPLSHLRKRSRAKRFIDDNDTVNNNNDNRQSISNDYLNNKTNVYIINNHCVINIVSTVTANGLIQTVTARPGTPVSIVATVPGNTVAATLQSPCVQMRTILTQAKERSQSILKVEQIGSACQNLTSVWNAAQFGIKRKNRIPAPSCDEMTDIFLAFMQNMPNSPTAPDPSCESLEKVDRAFEAPVLRILDRMRPAGSPAKWRPSALSSGSVKVVTAIRHHPVRPAGSSSEESTMVNRLAFKAIAPAGTTGYISLTPQGVPQPTDNKVYVTSSGHSTFAVNCLSLSIPLLVHLL
ncbi:Hypothetical protein D9617_3g021120 [Elsinoe fawcettii]|nr:Hypothetical protein D9617_3g021120 [Elsinoe fawcettii]